MMERLRVSHSHTFIVIIYGSTCLYMILPVTPSIVAILTNPNQTHIHGLLYHVEAVLDTKKYYYIILLHSYYATFFLMTIPVAADSMMIAYIQHACGLFQAIGYGSQRRESSSVATANSKSQMRNVVIRSYAGVLF
ncbi:uncharacterized protein LOC112552926 [Pogonomyrmex barbatus]|uniref:Uncharacterized protein LOC112552926 n=1 Tax=Pogonomyrmex barbatus TaxID=144034 RepID=A0A8N1S8N7_9HYME|nr:uncharacterized protein LOC112552926 [Pogonomyrmex barbatus]